MMAARIWFLALVAFCGSPADIEYWMPAMMRAMVTANPTRTVRKLMNGSTNDVIRSHFLESLVQSVVVAVGSGTDGALQAVLPGWQVTDAAA